MAKTADFTTIKGQILDLQDRTDDGKTITLWGVRVELKDEQIDHTKNLIVYADEVKINGTINLPSRNLKIVARNVIAAGASKISTVGNTGKDASQTPALDGQNPGDKGIDGKAGGPGDNGGNVTIFAQTIFGDSLHIDANGTFGGIGQPGGNGKKGAKGADSVDDRWGGTFHSPVFAGGGHPGLDGGAGGPGGDGGHGGRGGNAGSINLMTAVRNIVPALHTGPGTGGNSGIPGKAADGGDGGAGGAKHWNVGVGYRCMNRGDDALFNVTQYGPGSKGLKGKDGRYFQGDKGDPATTTDQLVGYAALRAAAPVEWLDCLKLTLRQAQLCYVNNEYTVAATLLKWIYDMAPAAGEAIPTGMAQAVWNEWLSLHSRAEALIRQLNLGLSYYGNYTNWVPLMSYGAYQETLLTMFQTAKDIDDAYRGYKVENAKTASRRSKLTAAANKVQAAATSMDDSSKQTAALIAETRAVIVTLTASLDATSEKVIAKEALFKQLVEKKVNDTVGVHCTLESAMHAIKEVAGVAMDVKSAVGGDVGSGFKALGDIKNIVGEINAKEAADDLLIKQMETAESGVKKLVEAINRLRTTPGTDAGKVLIEEKDLHDTLAPFREQAKESGIEDVLDEYLNLILTRNKKVLEYNKHVADQQRLQAKATALKASYSRIQGDLSQTFDPAAIQFGAFIAGVHGEVVDELTRLLVEFNAACNYLFMDEKVLTLANQTIQELDAQRAEIVERVASYINSSGGLTQPLNFTGKGLRLRVPVDDNFRKTRQVAIVIPLPYAGQPEVSTPDDPLIDTYGSIYSKYARVLATNFAVSIPKASTGTGRLSLTLTHSGQASMNSASGKARQYSHQPVSANFETKLETGELVDGGALGGGANNPQRIGLSPFTTWLLSVDAVPGLNLQSVAEVLIGFECKGISRTAPRRAKAKAKAKAKARHAVAGR